RRVYTPRQAHAGAEALQNLLEPAKEILPIPTESSERKIAALPYSSGTTRLPKRLMLSHHNLVANVDQLRGPHATEPCHEAAELARRFTALTGVLVCQGYGMTEASPVTHVGYLEPELYKPESIGQPLVETECRVMDEKDNEVGAGEPGELVMRGPQFMLGYWK